MGKKKKKKKKSKLLKKVLRRTRRKVSKKDNRRDNRRKISSWDAKKYGRGSNRGVKRISGTDIRRMVKKGIDPKEIIKRYDKDKFGKDKKTGGGTKKAVDKLRRSLEASKKYKKRGGGKGGAGGKGGGGGPERTTGPSSDQGLDVFEGSDGLALAELEHANEIELRAIDAENAKQLQNIINQGKAEVASLQRDASIYGSLVAGFW